MSKRVHLTPRDLVILGRALSDAQEDRDGMADAYGRTGPEAEEAKAWVEKYEKLHHKIFGRPTGRTQSNAEMAALPTVSIFELGKPKLDYDL